MKCKYCNDQIYTSALYYSATEKEDLADDIILGDEIGNVFGNHWQFWSVDEALLLESTCEGKLYRIN